MKVATRGSRSNIWALLVMSGGTLGEENAEMQSNDRQDSTHTLLFDGVHLLLVGNDTLATYYGSLGLVSGHPGLRWTRRMESGG